MPEDFSRTIRDKLYTNGSSSLYIALANNNPQNYQNNSEGNTKLVNNLNTSLGQINLIHNELNLLSNNNQEILLKKEELIQLENDSLNEQIQNLESIQGKIINKDRLIEEININIENQKSNIRVLIYLLILAIILLIVVYLNGSGKLDNLKFIQIIYGIIIIFFIIVIYSYNIFYFKDAITYLFDRRSLRLGNALKDWNTAIKDNVTTKLYGSESDWISNNCSCPVASGTVAPVYANDGNTKQAEIPGYFYYDGTAPQQLLVPLPGTDLNQNINWPDYSQDGSAKYNPSSKTTTYTNNNYYNYGAQHDPTVMLINKLDNAKKLVDEETNTANI
jgi:hypothetical protein